MGMFGQTFLYASYRPFSLKPKVPKSPTVTVVGLSVPHGLLVLTSLPALLLSLPEPQAASVASATAAAAALAASLTLVRELVCMGVPPGDRAIGSAPNEPWSAGRPVSRGRGARTRFAGEDHRIFPFRPSPATARDRKGDPPPGPPFDRRPVTNPAIFAACRRGCDDSASSGCPAARLPCRCAAVGTIRRFPLRRTMRTAPSAGPLTRTPAPGLVAWRDRRRRAPPARVLAEVDASEALPAALGRPGCTGSAPADGHYRDGSRTRHGRPPHRWSSPSPGTDTGRRRRAL